MADADQELRDAAECLLRAEFYFRLGPRAYSDDAQEWFVQAQQRLRKVLTGQRGLRKAFEALPVPRKKLKR